MGPKELPEMDPVAKRSCDDIKSRLHRQQRKPIALDAVQDFAENTTLHGLRYVADSGLSIAERIFWIIAFVTSLSLCTVLIYNVWEKWQTSPVLVALSEHLVFVGEVPFPSVTICPQIKSQRSVYNFSHEAVRIYQGLHDSNLTVEDINDSKMFEDVGLICWLKTIELIPLRNYSDAKIIEHIFKVSPNISESFRRCIWRQKRIDCKKLFSPVLTMEGLCFTMNSLASSEMFREQNIQKDFLYLNSSIKANGWSQTGGYSSNDNRTYPRRGRSNGGKPDLKITLQEKINDRDGLCNGINRGFKVYLQHPADLPQSSLYYYAALPKRRTSFALKFSILNTSSTLKNYHPETRQCFFPEERQLKYFLTYTTNNCRLECLSNYTFETCGCVWFHMPHNDSSTICREAKRTCVDGALERYASEEGRADTKIAICQCLPTCDAIDYEAETIETNYDAKKYSEAIEELIEGLSNTTIPDKEAEYEFAQVDMYYKEPQFVSMRRSELFGLTDFLANCGGLLGLFLGFSFLSLVEIVYFFTLRIGSPLRKNVDLTESNENKSDVTRM